MPRKLECYYLFDLPTGLEGTLKHVRFVYTYTELYLVIDYVLQTCLNTSKRKACEEAIVQITSFAMCCNHEPILIDNSNIYEFVLQPTNTIGSFSH